jgi:hypothetical protein
LLGFLLDWLRLDLNLRLGLNLLERLDVLHLFHGSLADRLSGLGGLSLNLRDRVQ